MHLKYLSGYGVRRSVSFSFLHLAFYLQIIDFRLKLMNRYIKKGRIEAADD